MNEAEFDKFADEYYQSHAAGLAASGEGPEYFSEYKIIDIARDWPRRSAGLNANPRVLDFGAGIGNSAPYVKQHLPGARLTCLDLSQRSLDVAAKRYPGMAEYVHFDGADIPFPDNHFDLAYAMCVFHHIDHDDHVAILRELNRVIRPGGRLYIFEHNPFNPLTVSVVNNCAFDANARLIRSAAMKHRMEAAGFTGAVTRYRIFFPRVLRMLRPIERAMAWLPLGGQYCVRASK